MDDTWWLYFSHGVIVILMLVLTWGIASEVAFEQGYNSGKWTYRTACEEQTSDMKLYFDTLFGVCESLLEDTEARLNVCEEQFDVVCCHARAKEGLIGLSAPFWSTDCSGEGYEMISDDYCEKAIDADWGNLYDGAWDTHETLYFNYTKPIKEYEEGLVWVDPEWNHPACYEWCEGNSANYVGTREDLLELCDLNCRLV